MLFWLPPTFGAQDDRAAAQAELEEITDRLNDLSAWLDGAERKRVRWQREIQTSDREVAKLSRRVDATTADLAALRDERRALESRQTELTELRRRQARQIAHHIASAYRISGQDFVKMLLNQQSPATLDRMIRYHGYFTAARMEALEAYRTTLQELEDNRQDIARQEREAERRQAELTSQQQALVAKREERRTLLARLNAEARDKEAERARLLADRKRLESLLDELTRRAQALDGRAFAQRKGALPWPVQGRVSNAFGQPRADGRLVWHGLMVAADEGTPVTAVFRGRVVFADWLRGFGLLTIVDHGSGYMTLYGHADALAKKVGDWVESGEIIARAGRSGGVTAPGLYFEVRQNGQATDPIVWLQKR